MLLALDIGNSTIVAAVFDNERIAALTSTSSTVQRSKEDTWNVIESFLTQNNIPISRIDGVGISSVVPFLTNLFADLSREKLQREALTVSGSTGGGVKILYSDPAQLGPDRICAATAGFAKFGGPLIIVDFGTATTYGVVSQDGRFMGGAISLGVRSAADALSQRTAQLPRIELQAPVKAIGTDTASAIQAGTMYGAVDALEGMIRRLTLELGSTAKVVATGGLCPLMSKQTAVIDACEPNLVLEGIRIIYSGAMG